MALLLKAINSSDTTIMFSSGDLNFPQDSGVIQIDSEIITYTTIYMGTMYGCTRGAQSTTPTSHTIASPILLVNFFSGVSTAGGGTAQFNYRKPNLIFITATTVTAESGLNGNSTEVSIIFPDGTSRSDANNAHIVLDVTQTAVLSGTAISGLQTGTVAANKWYAVYAVKVSDSATDFVLVGDLTLPIQSNLATLNTNFGVNSWVYLGMIRAGNNEAFTTELLSFQQSGSDYEFWNDSGSLDRGIIIQTGNGTYTNSRGTGAIDIPDHFFSIKLVLRGTAGAAQISGTATYGVRSVNIGFGTGPANASWDISSSGSPRLSICGFLDPLLGNGINSSL